MRASGDKFWLVTGADFARSMAWARRTPNSVSVQIATAKAVATSNAERPTSNVEEVASVRLRFAPARQELAPAGAEVDTRGGSMAAPLTVSNFEPLPGGGAGARLGVAVAPVGTPPGIGGNNAICHGRAKP